MAGCWYKARSEKQPIGSLPNSTLSADTGLGNQKTQFVLGPGILLAALDGGR